MVVSAGQTAKRCHPEMNQGLRWVFLFWLKTVAKCPLIVKKVKLKMGAAGNSTDCEMGSAMSVRGACGSLKGGSLVTC